MTWEWAIRRLRYSMAVTNMIIGWYLFLLAKDYQAATLAFVLHLVCLPRPQCAKAAAASGEPMP